MNAHASSPTWQKIRLIETLLAIRVELNGQRRDIAAHALSAGHQEIYAIVEEQAETLTRLKAILSDEWQRLNTELEKSQSIIV